MCFHRLGSVGNLDKCLERGERGALKVPKIGSWLTLASTLVGHIVILHAQRYLKQGTDYLLLETKAFLILLPSLP